ncbi:MAG: DUF493 domain-containing protein [Gemmataceae bacterium]|nr:DUF493 domain-containing protein [Gemmataceae bacterium]
MTRHPARTWTRRLALGAVALVALAGGCNGSRRAEPGGDTGRKAREAREQAERLAADAVKGAAAAQVAAHPELERKGPIGRARDFVAGHIPGFGPAPPAVVVARSGAGPTPPAPPPHPPVPPSVDVVVVRPAQPPVDTKPSAGVVIRERVPSQYPYPTEEKADADALDQAAIRIEQKLRELDPPVEYRPSAGVVRNEYLRRGSREVRDPDPFEQAELARDGRSGKYVSYTVEVTADQVRELRTRGRVLVALRLVGAVAGVALAAFLFLRLDEWTKGYLTSWLAFAAVALAGGVAAALVLV